MAAPVPASSKARLRARVTRNIARHQHFLLVLLVFLAFRLLMPFVFRSGSYFVEQAPDIGDYLRWGTLSDSGFYPYLDYWSEYPPLFPWSMIVLYRISTLLPAWPFDQRLWFAIVTQTATMLFDTGSLILLYAISLRLGSRARAVRTAALFAAAFITAYAASTWYEPVPLFFLLAALYLALRDRYVGSAAAAGVGIMLKIFPIVVVPVALRRMTTPRQVAGYLLALAVTSGAILLPFLLARADFVLASVQSTLNRPTWLSIWALFDGNYLYGVAEPIIERFTTENIGAPPNSTLPWPLIHASFLALYLVIYTRRVDWRAPVKSIALGGLTVNLFLLWSKGFSGQFISYAFPFLILLMPDLRGVVYTLLLSVLWVAEWPIAFNMLDGQNGFVMWIVIARTAVLVALCLDYAARLFSATAETRLAGFAQAAPRLASTLLVAGWISVIPAGVLAVHTYTETRLAADSAAPALEAIRSGSTSGSDIIAIAQPRLFRRLYPHVRLIGEPTLLPVFRHTPEEARLAWLSEIAAHGPFWFIADEGDPETLEENRHAEKWLSDNACKIVTTLAGTARLSRFMGASDAPVEVAVEATFADEIELSGARLSSRSLHPGDGLCVEISWQAIETPSSDYTVFVHLIDAQGWLVAQNDQQPVGEFAPTSDWDSGSAIADRHGILLPANLPPGAYILRVGMYRSNDQSPVRITRGEEVSPDGKAIVLGSLSVVP